MDRLPPVGLGTSGIEDPDTIAMAIDLGYRHFDTAQIYGNETIVGEGISRTNVDREELIVATKVWTDRLGADDVRPSVEASLNRLGLDHVDLLYVHWPRGDYEPNETLPAFDALVDDGIVERVGLSNFSPTQFDEARDVLDHPIFAHQIERHPLFQSSELVAYAQDHDHTLVSYAPLMAGRADERIELREIADAHGVTPPDISLAWVLSQDSVVAIPKASSRDHLQTNLEAKDIELTDDDIARIEGIEREEELYVD